MKQTIAKITVSGDADDEVLDSFKVYPCKSPPETSPDAARKAIESTNRQYRRRSPNTPQLAGFVTVDRMLEDISYEKSHRA